jgi:2-dehydro-3-deoxyphosphogluconate aldolase/(4S)-4-hydroxy-2-oxoglutarate aldolase
MRFTKEEIYQKLVQSPIVPVFYHEDWAYSKVIMKSCYKGGMRLFEFTNRGDNALKVFQVLQEFVQAECPEMALGIGTIYTLEEAQAFFDLGAAFIVQPVTTAAVGEFCQKKDLIWIPGAMTLNEIYQATQLGAEIIKIFPGNVLGSAFIKAIKAPMPKVKLMVTGGVNPTEASLKEWFEAGVVAVGIGSQLFQKNMLGEEANQKQTLDNKIQHLLHFVGDLKNGK